MRRMVGTPAHEKNAYELEWQILIARLSSQDQDILSGQGVLVLSYLLFQLQQIAQVAWQLRCCNKGKTCISQVHMQL
jgi:hypothetical protein